ncbi:hypothetical protein [Flammeovirga kamogawensis]|uniref:Uncharacterized protein n=1 Tax=Flammeovirga kamogawensis TaxID=373891 RepID=A0ABX8H3S6_9BACT|nr:hypothetical protein [Flammeovirga kamogawensis]MBB6463133.1 hypothetical protein [Flammeovirga kamogawensis]QWG10368.1 hypothetical protein KM029_25670 [Flammeovirga kamogawensis]TRX63878.1 hypothetical protein EO216_26045 [Flammeovirga kamogawensis]
MQSYESNLEYMVLLLLAVYAGMFIISNWQKSKHKNQEQETVSRFIKGFQYFELTMCFCFIIVVFLFVAYVPLSFSPFLSLEQLIYYTKALAIFVITCFGIISSLFNFKYHDEEGIEKLSSFGVLCIATVVIITVININIDYQQKQLEGLKAKELSSLQNTMLKKSLASSENLFDSLRVMLKYNVDNLGKNDAILRYEKDQVIRLNQLDNKHKNAFNKLIEVQDSIINKTLYASQKSASILQKIDNTDSLIFNLNKMTTGIDMQIDDVKRSIETDLGDKVDANTLFLKNEMRVLKEIMTVRNIQLQEQYKRDLLYKFSPYQPSDSLTIKEVIKILELN